MKMRIRWLALLLCLLLAVPGCACGEQKTDEKDVTVMIFMCGSDLESMHYQGTSTLAEINGAGLNREKVNAVALLGGATVWGRKYDVSRLTLVELGGRRPVEADSMPVANMGEPETLTAFLNYCRERYPARRYILILWDHGGGPNMGVCFDMLYERDSLSILELGEALGASVFADKGLELIAFNTCLTGSMEYALNLAPYARYMVATEDSMFGLGYDWLATLDTDSPEETLRKLVDSTYEFNRERIELQNEKEINSVAAVDLSKVGAVARAMDEFFALVTPSADQDGFLRVSSSRRNTMAFGVTESNGSKDYDLVDLGDLVRHLADSAPEKADALLKALNEAVPVRKSAREECTGLTVYHPYANKTYLKDFLAVHNSIPMSASYSAYIQQFAAMLTGTPLADWTNLRTEAASSKDSRTLFTLRLSEEQTRNYADARFQTLLRQEDGTYRLVYDHPFPSFSEGNLTGEYNGSALYAVRGTESETEALSPALSYEVSAQNTCMIPAVLTRKGNENGEPFTAQALICCTREGKSGVLKPVQVLLMDEATDSYTCIYDFAFEDFDEITIPVVSRRETRDENGVLKPFGEWETAGETSWTAPVDGSWRFSFLPDTLDEGDLYAAFLITDAQHNLYTSEPARVKAETNEAGEMRVHYDDKNLLLVNSLTAAMADGKLMLNAEVTNLTEQEAFITLTNLTLNGQAVDGSATAYGSGENWGLLRDEKQMLHLSVPAEALAGLNPLTDIVFELQLINAADESEVLGNVPVDVHLLLNLE